MPTFTFGVLYCFLVIGHDRRRILRFNVTRNPIALWIVQQMRECGRTSQRIGSLLSDRDAKFGNDVVSFAKGMGSAPSAPPFAVRGRTELRSVGWEVADEICSTT